MPSPLSHPRAATPKDMLMWAGLGGLAVGLLVAFWMLCSQQVEKAQSRDASAHLQSVAVADCPRYLPRSTFNTCADAGHRD